MYTNMIVWLHFLMFALLNPTVLALQKQPEIGQGLALDTIYAPDPPATNIIMLGIKYFDEALGREIVAELIIHLYGTVVPKTVENFAQVTKGMDLSVDPEKNDLRLLIRYKNTAIDKLIPNVMLQGGDVFPGITPFSIYGPSFEDENFVLQHDRPGRLSLYNDGKPDNNDSRFFISLGPEGNPEFNGKNVVFGQVVMGFDFLDKLQSVKVDEDGKPSHKMSIAYTVIDDLMIGNIQDLHKDWEERISSYNAGNLSLGVKIRPSIQTLEEKERLHDLMFQQANHPLTRISLGALVLLLIYYILRTLKRRSIRGSASTNNVVSMRQD